MKKVLTLLTVVLCSVILVSCSGSNGNDSTYNGSSFGFNKDFYITVVGNSGKVPFSGIPSKWSSSNEFIASVDGTGTIKGNHVGKCEIIASSSSGKQAKCIVTVEPIYTTYDDPYINWEASKSDVKAHEKRNLKKEDDNTLFYSIDNGVAMGLSYNFKNGKLVAILVAIEHNNKPSVATEVARFMQERYRVISVGKEDSYFSDGNDEKSSNTLIDVRINPSGYYGKMLIYYTKYIH